MNDKTVPAAIEAAYRLVRDAVIEYHDQPVGVVAALHPQLPAANYAECFVRDFVPSGLLFLLDGEYDIVRNFLKSTLELRTKQEEIAGHKRNPTVLPASFKVVKDSSGNEKLDADFGDRAIGQVAPVDSVLWWVMVLARYVETSGDVDFAQDPLFQKHLKRILGLMLQESFEIYPTLLTPDGCFMIDRRMGVYGHPLEVQALFYGALKAMKFLLAPSRGNKVLLKLVQERGTVLRKFVRQQYWLDLQRLNELHRFRTEEFGSDIANVLNVYPESIPDWVIDWLPDQGGYLAGNIGPSRLDFRFFALGNLAAIVTGLASEEMAQNYLPCMRRVGQIWLVLCQLRFVSRPFKTSNGSSILDAIRRTYPGRIITVAIGRVSSTISLVPQFELEEGTWLSELLMLHVSASQQTAGRNITMVKAAG